MHAELGSEPERKACPPPAVSVNYALALHSQSSACGTTQLELAFDLALHSQSSARGVKPGFKTPIAIAAPATNFNSVSIRFPSADRP